MSGQVAGTTAVPPGIAVRVTVPATSANLGPGFDSFGLALDRHDEVTFRSTASGLAIEVEGEGAAHVPRDDRHLVVRAAQATFDRLGAHPEGLLLRCVNRIPHSRGLGSSAAAIVAGVLGARALVPGGADRLGDDDVLDLAAGLEGHADNVAPCLLGGLAIAWHGPVRYEAVRVDPVQLEIVAFVPRRTLSTKVARGLLPEAVPHTDAAAQAAHAGVLVAALARGPGQELDAGLAFAGTLDRLHQAYREPAMPESVALLTHLRERGVAAVLSGAGPTVAALVRPGDGEGVAALAPEGFTATVVGVDRRGALAHRLEPGEAGHEPGDAGEGPRARAGTTDEPAGEQAAGGRNTGTTRGVERG